MATKTKMKTKTSTAAEIRRSRAKYLRNARKWQTLWHEATVGIVKENLNKGGITVEVVAGQTMTYQ